MKLDLLVQHVEQFSAKPVNRSKQEPVTFEVGLSTSPHIGDIVLRSRQAEFCDWARGLRCNEVVTVVFGDSKSVSGALVVENDVSFVPPPAKIVEKTPGN